MSKVSIEGNASGTGTLTIAAPNTNSNFTLSLPTNTGTIVTQNSTPAFASTIGVGGATAAASGAGITFPATASASSDANTLDDYEEGTFTPSFYFSSGSVTYSTQEAAYTKIGRLVHCTMAFVLSGVSSPTGSVGISGLPFTNGSGQGFVAGASIGLIRSLTASLAFVRAYVDSNSTTMSIAVNATNTGGATLQGSDLQAGTLFYLSVTYQSA
jgi:hypothetical protein